MTRLASGLATGAVTAFNVAFTMLQIPIGVIGVPLAMVILPSMSRELVRGGVSRIPVTGLQLSAGVSWDEVSRLAGEGLRLGPTEDGLVTCLKLLIGDHLFTYQGLWRGLSNLGEHWRL